MKSESNFLAYIFKQQHVKPKAKSNDEQGENQEELCEGFHDIRKHHNINAKLWEFAHEQNEANPREPYSASTNASMPVFAPRIRESCMECKWPISGGDTAGLFSSI